MSAQTIRQVTVRVALTGGIGSGKSTALLMFGARGAAVLSSDKVVHALLQREDVRQRVSESLELGQVDSGETGRLALADVVFADEKKLHKLEAILFPLVRAEISDWMESSYVASMPLAVVEIPMVFEAAMEDLFDKIVLVTAPTAVRGARHAGQVGKADFERRASQQLSEAEKEKRSDFVYWNTGSPDELDKFVERTVAALTTVGGM
ncbi:MAG: dephospho-CoA kinase [Thermoleophilia bacterium]